MLDEDERRVEVVVADDQFPLAIGRRGQNVRLASQLTGWQIDLITESADSERYQKEFQERTSLFMKALDADETLAQLLASEGFESVEEIAFVAPEDFITIEGFDKDVAEELQERAREFLDRVAVENDTKRRELGVEDDVMELDSMTPSFAVKLGEQGVKTVEDVAGLVPDDITGYREPGPDGKPVWVEGILKKGEMRKDDAQMFIMKARVIAGWIEQEAVDALIAQQAGDEEAPELTKRSARSSPSASSATMTDDEESLAEELGIDLADLQMEGGDEEAKKPYPSSEPGLIPENEMDDDGDASASPERQCAVTRERLPKEAMIRYVLSPDNIVTPDVADRLPGRGVWVGAERRHVDTAAAKGAFARGFKSAVTVPEGLSDLTERLLVKRCVELLGLARKAGLAIQGHDQVRDALRGKEPAFPPRSQRRAQRMGATRCIFSPKPYIAT